MPAHQGLHGGSRGGGEEAGAQTKAPRRGRPRPRPPAQRTGGHGHPLRPPGGRGPRLRQPPPGGALPERQPRPLPGILRYGGAAAAWRLRGLAHRGVGGLRGRPHLPLGPGGPAPGRGRPPPCRHRHRHRHRCRSPRGASAAAVPVPRPRGGGGPGPLRPRQPLLPPERTRPPSRWGRYPHPVPLPGNVVRHGGQHRRLQQEGRDWGRDGRVRAAGRHQGARRGGGNRAGRCARPLPRWRRRRRRRGGSRRRRTRVLPAAQRRLRWFPMGAPARLLLDRRGRPVPAPRSRAGGEPAVPR